MKNDIELYGLSITKKSNKTRTQQHNKQVLKECIGTYKKIAIYPFKFLYTITYSIVKYIDGLVFKSNFKKSKAIYNNLYIPEFMFKTKTKKSSKLSNKNYITISNNKNKIITI